MAAKYTPFQREILTKIDALSQKISNSEGQYKTIGGRVETLEEKLNYLEKLFKDNHNENINRLDQIVGDVAMLRDENTIGTYHTRELREDVDGHEKRIKRLESRQ
jgi:chromosome segregation ATPase